MKTGRRDIFTIPSTEEKPGRFPPRDRRWRGGGEIRARLVDLALRPLERVLDWALSAGEYRTCPACGERVHFEALEAGHVCENVEAKCQP